MRTKEEERRKVIINFSKRYSVGQHPDPLIFETF